MGKPHQLIEGFMIDVATVANIVTKLVMTWRGVWVTTARKDRWSFLIVIYFLV